MVIHIPIHETSHSRHVPPKAPITSRYLVIVRHVSDPNENGGQPSQRFASTQQENTKYVVNFRSHRAIGRVPRAGFWGPGVLGAWGFGVSGPPSRTRQLAQKQERATRIPEIREYTKDHPVQYSSKAVLTDKFIRQCVLTTEKRDFTDESDLILQSFFFFKEKNEIYNKPILNNMTTAIKVYFNFQFEKSASFQC